MTLPAGQGQGNVVLAAGGNVDLCTLLQEQLRHSQMALSGGEGGRERSREGGREREMTTCIYVTTYIHVYKKEDLMNCVLDGECPKEFQYGRGTHTCTLSREGRSRGGDAPPRPQKGMGHHGSHLRLK